MGHLKIKQTNENEEVYCSDDLPIVEQHEKNRKMDNKQDSQLSRHRYQQILLLVKQNEFDENLNLIK